MVMCVCVCVCVCVCDHERMRPGFRTVGVSASKLWPNLGTPLAVLSSKSWIKPICQEKP
jgi:hypothetical protein